MHAHFHTLGGLFAQLGLPSMPDEVEGFLSGRPPLPGDMCLSEAPFWSPAQAAFLQEEILGDADWAEVVDQLNMRLH